VLVCWGMVDVPKANPSYGCKVFLECVKKWIYCYNDQQNR
jgi:hypothetical protein